MQYRIILSLLLISLYHRIHRLRAEAYAQTVLIRLNRLVTVVQALGEVTKDFPLFGALAIYGIVVVVAAGSVKCWGRGLWLVRRFSTRHVSAPNSIDAQVFVQDHEEIVQPTLAKALVLELRVVRKARVMLRMVSEWVVNA